MRIESFTDIEAWKQSRKLVAEIYSLCNQSCVKHDYGFRDQIQRAAVSIMSNIAEGFDGDSDKQFTQFLSYSLRSASEVESLLYVALDVGYIDNSTFTHLTQSLTSIKKIINGFVRYLKNNPQN